MALVLVHVLDNFVGELIRRIGKHESLISTIKDAVCDNLDVERSGCEAKTVVKCAYVANKGKKTCFDDLDWGEMVAL